MRVLIIGEDNDLNRSVATYLKRENYSCEVVNNMATGSRQVESFARQVESFARQIGSLDYDCVVLDFSPFHEDGYRILRQLCSHRSGSGLIVLSAASSVEECIAGLNLGADDYLPKPVSLPELTARITAVIRRRRFQGLNLVTINELVIDMGAKVALVNKEPLDLTRKEFDLLLCLVCNKNRVMSKNVLSGYMAHGPSYSHEGYSYVYNHIKNLKKKLAEAGCKDYIRSIYGRGYKFSETEP
jgi:DNA-binding response OmpR family regulator